MNLEDIQRFRNKQGIYCLYMDNEVVYIGYSVNIYTRILEHIAEDKKEFTRLKAFDGSKFNTQENLLVEMGLICELKPLYNKIRFESFFMWFHSLPNREEYDYESTLKKITILFKNINILDDDRMVKI